MDINQIIDNASEQDIKSALKYFLQSYMNPAFGALPKNEVELIVLNVLEQLKALDREPQLYEFVSKLRITRSKARKLIYDRELRRSSEQELDNKIKTLLKNPIIQKNGDLYVIEVENPLVSDHFRAKVQKLGYISDGSFSPSIIKLGLDAITSLIESYLTAKEQRDIKAALIDAGAPDTSFKGILKVIFKKLGSKVASDTGEILMGKASGFISSIFDVSIDLITEKTKELLKDT